MKLLTKTNLFYRRVKAKDNIAFFKTKMALLLVVFLIISIHPQNYSSAAITATNSTSAAMLNSSSTSTFNSALAAENKLKAVTVVPSIKISALKLKGSGFNTVLLNLDPIRAIQKPYNTNYKALKQLYRNIQTLEAAGLSYVLCFTSGPGYSMDSSITTIYKNKAEQQYFSQMVTEVLNRYSNKSYPHLLGASIAFVSPNVDYRSYYEIQDHIIGAVEKKLGNNIRFLYNLHILTFEDKLQNLPIPTFPTLAVNLPISLNALNYPGYGAAQKTSCPLTKNALLSTLEKMDNYAAKSKLSMMLSLKTPWVKNSEVLLQDIFELFKMIKLNYSLSYANSNDRFDFTTNSNVLKVINRHNK